MSWINPDSKGLPGRAPAGRHPAAEESGKRTAPGRGGRNLDNGKTPQRGALTAPGLDVPASGQGSGASGTAHVDYVS